MLDIDHLCFGFYPKQQLYLTKQEKIWRLAKGSGILAGWPLQPSSKLWSALTNVEGQLITIPYVNLIILVDKNLKYILKSSGNI